MEDKKLEKLMGKISWIVKRYELGEYNVREAFMEIRNELKRVVESE